MTRQPSECSIPGCSASTHGDGLCQRHYRERERKRPRCKLPGCNARAEGHGYCRPHERQALDDLPPGVLGSVLDRIGQGVTVDHTGCWLAPEWMMTHSSETYSEVRLGGQDWLGHRLLYVLLIGGHANGRELDHLCNNPRCLRPNHLEPLTAKQNAKRREERAKNPDASWWRSDWRAAVSLALLGWAGRYGLPVAPSDAFTDGQGRTVIRRP